MKILASLLALLLAIPAIAADPPWTQQYLFNQSPESNGFTRVLKPTVDADQDGTVEGAIVTEVTSGTPSNRRVEINSDEGNAYFITSQVPSLDPNVGATVEWRVAVSGAGDAGAEMTFLNRFVGVEVYETGVWITISSGPGNVQHYAATASNSSQTLWRLTLDSSQQVRLYRAGVLVLGPYQTTEHPKPFQRVLWWGESGGTQTYYILRYWSGGAMAP